MRGSIDWLGKDAGWLTENTLVMSHAKNKISFKMLSSSLLEWPLIKYSTVKMKETAVLTQNLTLSYNKRLSNITIYHDSDQVLTVAFKGTNAMYPIIYTRDNSIFIQLSEKNNGCRLKFETFDSRFNFCLCVKKIVNIIESPVTPKVETDPKQSIPVVRNDSFWSLESNISAGQYAFQGSQRSSSYLSPFKSDVPLSQSTFDTFRSPSEVSMFSQRATTPIKKTTDKSIQTDDDFESAASDEDFLMTVFQKISQTFSNKDNMRILLKCLEDVPREDFEKLKKAAKPTVTPGLKRKSTGYRL